MKIEIKKQKYIPKIETVEVELPTEICYYFITGERKSYKVIPKFQDWESGNGEVYGYDIVKVGLSFECVIEQFGISVSDIPDILDGEKCKFAYHIVDRMINEPEYMTRTKEQFEDDLQTAIDKIKDE